MPFYEDKPQTFLRFGDVIRGYLTADITIKEPMLKIPSELSPYRIDISTPMHCVVLTPCCSIENGSIAISPLIPLRSDFLKNPYFAADFTRINRQMTPEQSLPPVEWARLGQPRKDKLLSEGNNYSLLQFFIYAPSDNYKPYMLRGTSINYYMVDFKDIHEIKCSLLKRPEEIKQADEMTPIIDSKVLQLTTDVRAELRNKFTYFYSRVPAEDVVVA